MELFTWDDSYSVGLNSIDAQHKHLLDIINTLFDSMKKGVSYEVFDSTLLELANYTDTHFMTEEVLFTKYQYPDKDSHVMEHNDFRNKVTKLKEEHISGENRLSIETLHFLQKWVIHHIKTVDKSYEQFFDTLNLS